MGIAEQLQCSAVPGSRGTYIIYGCLAVRPL